MVKEVLNKQEELEENVGLDEIIEQQVKSGFAPEDNRIFIETPDARNVLMRGITHFCGKDAQWLPEYESMALWLSNNNGRGLLCYGNCGRGKTLITQRILPIIFRYWHGLALNTITATELSERFNEISGYKIISVDDIGTEDIANRYGEKHDYFRELVDLAERKQKLLIVSTNLELKQIAERYGERTIDRLRALTTTILFKGTSLRK